MKLSELSKGELRAVDHVEAQHDGDTIARRLRDLGFVHGEPVRVLAFGPFGADPIVVQIAGARFALRKSEAARVIVREALA